MDTLRRFALQVLLFSPLGYAFPRFLVALGVPLDKWADALGTALNSAYINFESALWGFVLIFTLVMFWVEAKYDVTGTIFRAMRPVRLSDDEMFMLIRLLEEGGNLQADPAPRDAQWQQRVVEWDRQVQGFVREKLPPNELFAYRTIAGAVAPAMGQRVEITAVALAGRSGKLRLIGMRLQPLEWSTRQTQR